MNEVMEIVRNHAYTSVEDLVREHLLNEDETIAKFHIVNEYIYRYCIIPKDFKPGDDFAACLEMTLHRLKDTFQDDTFICAFMGAVPEDEIDRDFNPEEEWTTIDLGYAIPNGIGTIEMPDYEED